ncbi:hypothetical protein JQX13_24110 [Archangium violaceum]|uniref:hypothetical protein n=1 Tax=Archangium violaceum TaxID=83451 RepID=UPI00193B78F5|nr:hypothetical protein [Archangium violaceum]QRK12844.1 hypothetical protein JQX13_24110 [Archangium violaceum]
MSMLNSRAGLLVLAAAALLAPGWAEASCKYYDNASAAVSPLPPTDSFVSCQLDAITHGRFHVTACRPDNAPPGVDMNASALRSWLRCYDMRDNPPRCLGTYYRSSSQCINGKPYPSGIGAVTLCREACSEGEWARQTYFVPGNPSQLPPGYPFVSAVDTIPGKAILDLYQYLNQAHDTVVQENGENLPTQLAVLDLATLSLFVADDS